jgi:malate dehydrogenase
MFGEKQPVILHLLEIASALPVLHGVVMELEDCALPLLHGVVPTADYTEGFAGVDYAILVGAMPRKEGMERSDLLKANVSIFKGQGEAINKHASRNVKVLVVGNPANTNAAVCSHYAPSVPKENFSALTRLDHNRAVSLAARRLKVPVDGLEGVIIWGNHSGTQFADVSHATTSAGRSVLVADEAYFRGEYVSVRIFYCLFSPFFLIVSPSLCKNAVLL